jgi:hypothetical protein
MCCLLADWGWGKMWSMSSKESLNAAIDVLHTNLRATHYWPEANVNSSNSQKHRITAIQKYTYFLFI